MSEFYSPNGNIEIWDEKPEEYLYPQEYDYYDVTNKIINHINPNKWPENSLPVWVLDINNNFILNPKVKLLGQINNIECQLKELDEEYYLHSDEDDFDEESYQNNKNKLLEEKNLLEKENNDNI
jgi:hypothetical protein